MPTIDVEALLSEISPGDPCGPDLEYDAEMRELEQASQGKPEQQIGETIVAAQEPDWRDVRRRAIALFARSKDLRIANTLARALLHTDGFVGLADGLGVMRGLIERYWETLHPRLDPDDNNDPTMRINIVMGLCDQSATLVYVRNTPFVSAANLGRFSLRELAFAAGESTPPEGETAPSLATIEGAFLEAPLESITATATALDEGLAHLRELESKLTDYVGSANAPNLDPLRRLVYQAAKFVKEKLGARTAAAESEAPVDSNNDGAAAGASAGATTTSGRTLSGDIRSREDVVRALDKIIEYYGRFEPSSPVPILVKRCKRLVTASFEDIVRNLIPDAVNQLEVFKGPADETGS
ncbi:MAG: type VI secretion system protein TssA [Deltaproteobacteria bacterium]|nr:type VI secretion system protein TssA [Deltaproteobacteria bacterium]